MLWGGLWVYQKRAFSRNPMIEQLFIEIGVLYDNVIEAGVALNKARYDIVPLMTVDERREHIDRAQEAVNKVMEARSAPMETIEMMQDQDLPDSMRHTMEEIMGHIDALRDITEEASIALNKDVMQNYLDEALDIEQVIENALSNVMDLEESDENNASNASLGGRRTLRKQRKQRKDKNKRTLRKRSEKRTLRKKSTEKKRRAKRTLRK